MQSVTLNYRVGDDGIIHLDIPIGLTNAELQVTVTFQTVTPETRETTLQGKGCPVVFFEDDQYGLS